MINDNSMKDILNGNYFFISSENCDSFRGSFYGYAILDDQLLIRKSKENIFLDKNSAGMYVNIIEDGNKLIIQQDYWCGFGLFLFRKDKFWAISNSFLILVQNISERFKLTINEDFAALYISWYGGGTFSIFETIIKEINELPRGEFIIIDKSTKTIKIEKLIYKSYYIDVYSKEAAKLIDEWHNKYLSLFDTLLENKYYVDTELSGGFDSRCIFGITSRLLNKGICVSSRIGNEYTYNMDFEIAKKIADIYNFKLNIKSEIESVTINSKQSLLIALYSQMFSHEEYAYLTKYYTNYNFRVGGLIGEVFRGSVPHVQLNNTRPLLQTDRNDFLNRAFVRYQDEELINNARSLLIRQFNFLDKNFKDDIWDSQNLYNHSFVRNHAYRHQNCLFLTNVITINPFLDPVLLKLNMSRHGVEDTNLLHAILLNRFLPELDDIPFESNRCMNAETVKTAKKFNIDFPYTALPKYSYAIVCNPVKAISSPYHRYPKSPAAYMESVYADEKLKSFIARTYSYKLWIYGLEQKNIKQFCPEKTMNKLNSLYFLDRILNGKYMLPDIGDTPQYSKGYFEYLINLISTCRIDIFNHGSKENTLIIIDSNDSDLKYYYPPYLADKDCKGLQIESQKKNIKLRLKVSGKGKVEFWFRAPWFANELMHCLNIEIDYNYISIFSLKKNISLGVYRNKFSCTHNHPFIINYELENGEEIDLNIKFSSHDYNIDKFNILLENAIQKYTIS